MSAAGRIWGLGIGPGDPELITLKALRLLASADVIAYPAPEGGESLVRAIAGPHLPAGAEEIVIETPMRVERHPAQDVYDKAAAAIGARSDAGKSVAVLCEGDPFFYGSFMYLFARLSERHEVTVVPGVSSLNACAAELGLPLASRNDVVSVIPATLGESELAKRLAQTDVAVIIKVGRHLEKLRRVLERMNAAGRARYIERATMANQRILPLDSVAANDAPYFSMVILPKNNDGSGT